MKQALKSNESVLKCLKTWLSITLNMIRLLSQIKTEPPIQCVRVPFLCVQFEQKFHTVYDFRKPRVKVSTLVEFACLCSQDMCQSETVNDSPQSYVMVFKINLEKGIFHQIAMLEIFSM